MTQDPDTSGASAGETSRRLEYLGDPTLARVMRRPRWLLALLLALIVAAVFAWLGQWQLDNAIRTDTDETVAQLEIVTPIGEIAQAGEPLVEAAGGAVVTVAGTFRADDLMILEPRQNGDELGVWVVAHLIAAAPETSGEAETGHLAVAVGWAPDTVAAEAAIAELEKMPDFTAPVELEGRLMPTEGAITPGAGEDPSQLKSMLPAHLVNLWTGVDGPAYAGYLVMHPEMGGADLLEAVGLDPIDSVAPEPADAISWLNVFYAIEWVVFAGFAVFLWYRLTRDAWEKEHEMQLLLAAEAQEHEE